MLKVYIKFMAHLLATITSKATLVICVAQSSDHLSFYEKITCGTFGAKRLLVTSGTVIGGSFVKGVGEKASLRQRGFAL